MRDIVVVMGVSGSGKSTVGKLLARRLGVPYEEGDDLHPAANVAKMAAGQPLDDADRAPWLDAVAEWIGARAKASARAGRGGVVSCSALRRRYRDRLREAGTEAAKVVFLHLDGSEELIAARLAARSGHFMPPGLLRSQFESLEPLGADEAGAVVPLDSGGGGGAEETVTRALAALAAYTD